MRRCHDARARIQRPNKWQPTNTSREPLSKGKSAVTRCQIPRTHLKHGSHPRGKPRGGKGWPHRLWSWRAAREKSQGEVMAIDCVQPLRHQAKHSTPAQARWTYLRDRVHPAPRLRCHLMGPGKGRRTTLPRGRFLVHGSVCSADAACNTPSGCARRSPTVGEPDGLRCREEGRTGPSSPLADSQSPRQAAETTAATNGIAPGQIEVSCAAEVNGKVTWESFRLLQWLAFT